MKDIEKTILDTILEATDEEIESVENAGGSGLPAALKMGIMLLQVGVAKRVAKKLMKEEAVNE